MRLATIFDQQHGVRPVIVMRDDLCVDLGDLHKKYASEITHTHPSNGHPEDTALSLHRFLAMEQLWTKLPWMVDQWQALWRDKEKNPEAASVRTYRDVSFLPPILRPNSYRDFYAFEQHVKTCRAKRGLPVAPEWYEIPVFYFSNPGTLVGNEQPVHAPQGCNELDYELELAAIIGKEGSNIPEERAWEHIAGFTILNDFSARDLQRKEMAVGLGPAKGKDFATGVGPYLVTLDEIRDRIDPTQKLSLEMTARVNGKVLSKGNSGSMHYTWPRLIAQASRDATLFAGDLIGSGTVGTGCILELGPENTGGWLKPGDVVELEIERLGILKNPIQARS